MGFSLGIKWRFRNGDAGNVKDMGNDNIGYFGRPKPMEGTKMGMK